MKIFKENHWRGLGLVLLYANFVIHNKHGKVLRPIQTQTHKPSIFESTLSLIQPHTIIMGPVS